MTNNWFRFSEFPLGNENRRCNKIAELFNAPADTIDCSFITETVLSQKDMDKLVEEREDSALNRTGFVGGLFP